MTFYHSKITKKIFQNCDAFWDTIMIESIDWRSFTWNQYKNLILNYTQKLADSWIIQGDSVVIFVKDLVTFSYISIAVLLAWAKLVIIEPDMWERILEEKLKFIKPDLLIIESSLYYLLKIPLIRNTSKIKKYKSLLTYSSNILIESWNSSRQNSERIPDTDQEEESNKEHESIVVFTWGTTWNPKWVVHTLESLEVMFDRISRIIWTQTKVFYADLPHFILIWICLWARTVVWKNNIWDHDFYNAIEKYKVDTTFSPPYRYKGLITSNISLPQSLRHVCLWSAPVYTSFLEEFYNYLRTETKITCIYGMTEILPIAYIDGRGKIANNIDSDILWEVFSDLNINILADWEWEISGKWLFKKYLWWIDTPTHKTWDILAYQGKYLVMKWRKKDMILRKDYNIYPSIYEPVINSIPWIIESALIWVFNKEIEDEVVILFLETDALQRWKKAYSKTSILDLLWSWRYSIDNYAIPDDIVFVKNLPRIWRQNKIDKNYLRTNYWVIWK